MVIVVTYHAISSPRSPISVPAASLANDLHALARAGFTFVSMDQCGDWAEGKLDLPTHVAVITFDDGYASVAREGLRILREVGAPATVYVVAGRIGSDNRWQGQHPRVRPMPLVNEDDIRRLVDANVTIGSHSMSHPSMTALDESALEREVVASAERLESIVGAPIRHFSYPYGLHSERVVAAVKRRYRTAVTATCRSVDRDSDTYRLPRLDAHDLRVAAQLGLLDSPWLEPYLSVRRAARRARRLAERVTGGGWEGLR